MNYDDNNFGGLNIGDTIATIPVDPFYGKLIGEDEIIAISEQSSENDTIHIRLKKGNSIVVPRKGNTYQNDSYYYAIWDNDAQEYVDKAILEATRQFSEKVLKLKAIRGMF